MTQIASFQTLSQSQRKSLLERDRDCIWHPFTQVGRSPTLISVLAARGAALYLDGERTVVDGISSWWCNLHGHGEPSIAHAIAEQVSILDHVLFGGCTHEPAVQLAERLLPLLPPNQGKVFYSDNGSTATEVAIKISIQRWRNKGQKRNKIIALEGAYHGDTFGAMSVSGRGIFSAPFNDHLLAVEHLPVHGDEKALARAITKLESLCQSGEVAAFIFEPLVQGAGGFVMYNHQILERYLDVCTRYEVLTIADEVMTGFGRTGPLFVSNTLTNPPDMICLSKGLTGGTLPLAVTTCTNELFNDFISPDHSKTFFHGHTYTANPIACAAALASLTLTVSERCTNQREEIANCHQEFISQNRQLLKNTDARALGTILALEIPTESKEQSERGGYTDPIGERVARFCIDRGVLLRPLGATLYVMPPYCIQEDELSKIYSVICELLRTLS